MKAKFFQPDTWNWTAIALLAGAWVLYTWWQAQQQTDDSGDNKAGCRGQRLNLEGGGVACIE